MPYAKVCAAALKLFHIQWALGAGGKKRKFCISYHGDQIEEVYRIYW